MQRVHLVFHQRDERRDDDGEAVARERGKLEAERFAAASRQQREDIFARQRIADDFLLQRAERGEAEVLLQQREQFWSGGFHCFKNRTDKVALSRKLERGALLRRNFPLGICGAMLRAPSEAAGFGLVVDDFAARAEGLHGVNQPRVHGIAVQRTAGVGEDV